MSDRIDTDGLLLAVRAARPAGAPEDSASSAAGQAVLARACAGRHGPGGPGHRNGAGDPGDPDARDPLRPRRARARVRRRLARLGPGLVPALGALAALAIGLLAIVGLDHHRPTRAPATANGTARRHLTPAAYAFALGGESAGAAGRLLFNADQKLRGRCMAASGLHYIPSVWPDTTLPGARTDLPSSTGYPTTWYPQPIPGVYPEAALLAEARSTAFGIHLGAVALPSHADPDDTYVSTLSPARRRTWIRTFDGRHGCMWKASDGLYGSPRAAAIAETLPTLLYDTLNGAAYRRNGVLRKDDGRIAASAAAWSRCMLGATGRDYADETALINALFAFPPRTERTAGFARLERSDAVADVRCAYASGQAQTFAAAFHAAANRLPKRVASELRFVLAHRAHWLARARAVLAGHP